jgi:hypothetical protein
MFFKLLAGRHKENGKTYSKGDVVESAFNLVELFPNTFERDVEKELSRPQTVAAPTPPVQANDFGEDVTADFPDAGPNGFFVYKRAKGFVVVDGDNPDTPVNKKPIKLEEVVPLIDSFFEEE